MIPSFYAKYCDNEAKCKHIRLPKKQVKTQPCPLLISDLLWQVGNEFIRGISGGERKRTNIGMELIMSPSVLFLDEPTTGLDASTAASVIQLLQG